MCYFGQDIYYSSGIRTEKFEQKCSAAQNESGFLRLCAFVNGLIIWIVETRYWLHAQYFRLNTSNRYRKSLHHFLIKFSLVPNWVAGSEWNIEKIECTHIYILSISNTERKCNLSIKAILLQKYVSASWQWQLSHRRFVFRWRRGRYFLRSPRPHNNILKSMQAYGSCDSLPLYLINWYAGLLWGNIKSSICSVLHERWILANSHNGPRRLYKSSSIVRWRKNDNNIKKSTKFEIL